MNAKAEELHSDLMTQVGELRTSKDWLEAMAAAARFHSYSFGNWLLLWAQGERRGIKVTRPAGYRAWQTFNRHVRKGEKGFKIIAPMTRKDEDGDTVMFGFRVVTVFDVSQTDGEPLPDVGAPDLLEGEGDTVLQEAAIKMIEAEGFTFTIDELTGPNGVTKPSSKEVIVDGRLSPAQATKTTVHELAHVLLHSSKGEFTCRGTGEVEAESVAYVVCAAAGLDTSQYSVKYVAGWAEATDDPGKAMLATAEVVVRTARKILASLEPESLEVAA